MASWEKNRKYASFSLMVLFCHCSSGFPGGSVWNWVYAPKGMLMGQGPYTNAPQHLCATGKGHWTFASYFSAQEFLFIFDRKKHFFCIWQTCVYDVSDNSIFLTSINSSLSWIHVCAWMCVERVRGRGMLGCEGANTDWKHTLKFSLNYSMNVVEYPLYVRHFLDSRNNAVS